MSENLRISKMYYTNHQTLFQKFQDPVELTKWMFINDFSRSEIKSNFIEGGEYKVRTFLENGLGMEWSGVYQSIKPNHSIEYTWYDNELLESKVKIDFKPTGENTALLSVTQTNLPNIKTMLEYKALWLDLLQHLEGCVDNIEVASKVEFTGDSYY